MKIRLDATDTESPFVAVVIPAYKASRTICAVVSAALPFASLVIVVDDGCPEHTGALTRLRFADDPRVVVIERSKNGGVGAATKAGLERAIASGAEYAVKLDADGQMDPMFIPSIVEVFERHPDIAFVKGNRFTRASTVRAMPMVRLLGNAVLSILSKFSSGYWNLLDPTNGYIAFRVQYLESEVDMRSLADRYFFELSVLCELGIQQVNIAELEMPAIYGSQGSSLSIARVIFDFPPRLLRSFLKRFALQYFLFDVNLGSLFIIFGAFFTTFGLTLTVIEFVQSYLTQVPRTTGTVMLAIIPFLIGVQLFLNALIYDVQSSPTVFREMRSRSRARPGRVLIR